MSVSAATFTGKALYKGKPIKANPIQMKADPNCLKETGGKTVLDEAVVVTGDKLANVFVYVKEGKGGAPAPTEPVTFDQRGCHYNPHVVGLRVGQPLKILNSDGTSHNVHSMAKGNTPFNAAMPTKGMTIEKKFTKPEQMVKVKCDIHGWMVAHIGVMDHPFFAVSGTDGAFTIKDLAPGEYTLVAWHEKLGTKEEKIKVTDAGIEKPVEFSFN